MEKECFRCHTKESEKWWKCCPRHTTEQGPDVLCEKCKDELHNATKEIEHRNIFDKGLGEFPKVEERCPVQKHGGWGSTSQCTFKKDHDGPHSWVAY